MQLWKICKKKKVGEPFFVSLLEHKFHTPNRGSLKYSFLFLSKWYQKVAVLITQCKKNDTTVSLQYREQWETHGTVTLMQTQRNIPINTHTNKHACVHASKHHMEQCTQIYKKMLTACNFFLFYSCKGYFK